MFQGIMLQISKPIERSPMIILAKSEIRRVRRRGPGPGVRRRTAAVTATVTIAAVTDSR